MSSRHPAKNYPQSTAFLPTASPAAPQVAPSAAPAPAQSTAPAPAVVSQASVPVAPSIFAKSMNTKAMSKKLASTKGKAGVQDKENKERATRTKFIDGVHEMLNNSLYSDVIIKIKNTSFFAHQIVLGLQSTTLEKKLAENKTQGSNATEPMKLEFTQGSEAAWWRVLEYLYTGDYSLQLLIDSIEDDTDLLKHVRVYNLAESFKIDNLKRISQKKLEVQISSFHMCELFAKCVREVYATTTSKGLDSMRGVVVNALIDHVDYRPEEEIDEEVTVLELNYIHSLFREGGDFAVDYFKQRR